MTFTAQKLGLDFDFCGCPACLLGLVSGQLLPYGLQRVEAGGKLWDKEGGCVDVWLRSTHSIFTQAWKRRNLEEANKELTAILAIYTCNKSLLHTTLLLLLLP